MTIAIINRRDMTLACKLETILQCPDYLSTGSFVAVDMGAESSSALTAAFATFTDYEMKVLYRNLGNVPKTVINQRPSVLTSVCRLIYMRPFTDPEQLGLFTKEKAAAPVKSRAPQAGAGDDRPKALPTIQAPAKGSVRDVIWSHADKVWEAAGKPVLKEVVLPLRKQMMAELEAQGIKKTSSSNELGNWMKNRIPA